MDSYRKGGLKGNSNLLATNRLFVKNPLFKKRKKKAPGVYDPNAKYRYKEGGVSKDPSIVKLDKLKPGGAPCPRGQIRDASGKCVLYNWGSGNIQAADSYAGMYGGYDRSGVKNLKQVSANAKKGKKLADYIKRGGKTRAEVARNIGKNAGQYFGMPGEAIEPVNYTKAGLDKFTADVKGAKKNSEAIEKDYQKYLKSKEKVSKGKMDSSKYAKEFDQKGWSQYDANTNTDYSAKEAREAWGDSDEWKKFTGLVSNAATAIPLLGAAGAMGSAGAALLENPVVQGGLTAYGAYDAATNTIPEAVKDFSEGRYLEGMGNVGLASLDLVPGVGLASKGLKAGAKGVKNLKTAAKNKYVDIAEGDNIFDYAWRSPANRFDDAAIKPTQEIAYPQSQAEFNKLQSLDNLTDQEKVMIKDYETYSRHYTGRGMQDWINNPFLEKKQAFEQTIGNAKVQSDKPFVMTRRINTENPELFNMNKGVYEPNRITSWSAGRDNIGNTEFSGGKDRLVIKNKAGESNVFKNPYEGLTDAQKQQYREMLKKESPDRPDEFIDRHLEDFADVNRSFERELILPADAKLKQLGKVKNKIGGYDYVMRRHALGGSTNDSIEIDIPEEEIQWYIDNGYIVEPVTKLKKFIG
jgi:hypothetical protein